MKRVVDEHVVRLLDGNDGPVAPVRFSKCQLYEIWERKICDQIRTSSHNGDEDACAN